VHYSHHAHAFTDEDWTALLDFSNKYVRKMPVSQTFDKFLTMDERAEAVKAATAARGPRPSDAANPRPGTTPR
jgi:hypothetical protein